TAIVVASCATSAASSWKSRRWEATRPARIVAVERKRLDLPDGPSRSNPNNLPLLPGGPGTQRALDLLDLDPELGNVAGRTPGKIDDPRAVEERQMRRSVRAAEQSREGRPEQSDCVVSQHQARVVRVAEIVPRHASAIV